MLVLKRFMMLLGFLFAVSAQAHPGHPALSLAHTHRAYEFDSFLIPLLAALAVTIVWWRIRRGRRHERKL